MKIIILSVGKPKNVNFSALAEHYVKRLRPFVKIGMEYAPEERGSNSLRKVQREGQEILKKFRERDYVVLLENKGWETDSCVFADWVSGRLDGVDGRIVFVIGGAFGLSGDVKLRGHCTLSLSKMTMPHELCHVFLLEQLYRAFTILHGVEYHH